MPRWKRFVVARVFPWFVVAVGSGFVFLGVENTSRAGESVDWPTVEGRVIRTTIELETQRTTARSAATTTWRPVVVYEYMVGGTRYEGDRVAFGEYATADRGDAEAVVAKYGTGTAVSVSFDTSDPSVAVIEPGDAGVPWLFAALGALFVVVGLGFAVLFPKLVARGIG
jgi:hypothetical protein